MEIDDEKFVHRVNEAFVSDIITYFLITDILKIYIPYKISEATKNGLGTTTENFVQRGLDFIRNCKLL